MDNPLVPDFTNEAVEESVIPVISEETTENLNAPHSVSLDEKSKPSRKQIPQLTEGEMVAIIQQFKASGLTRRAFCLENGYGLSSLYYWQKKYDALFPEEKKIKGSAPKKKAEKVAKEPKAKKVAEKKLPKAKKQAEIKPAAEVAEIAPEKAEVKTRKKAAAKVEKMAEVIEDQPEKRRGRPKGSKNKAQEVVATEKPKRGKSKPVAAEPVEVTAEVTPAAEQKKKPGRPPKARVAKKGAKAKKVVGKKPVSVVAEVKAEPVVPKPEVKAAPVKRGRKAAVSAPEQSGVTVMQIKYPNGVRINVTADISLERLKELISL